MGAWQESNLRPSGQKTRPPHDAPQPL